MWHQRWAALSAASSSIIAALCMAGALGLLKLMPSALGITASHDADPVKGGQPGPLASLFDGVQAQVAALVAPFITWTMAAPLSRAAIAILVLYFFKGCFDYLAEYGMQKIGLRLVGELRTEVYERVLHQSDSYFWSRPQGDLMSRVTSDTSRLQRILGTDVGQLLQSIPVAIVMFLLALYFALPVTAVCLFVVPVFVLVASRLGSRVRKSARRSQERAGRLTGVMEETLLARRVVQAFGAERWEVARFSRLLKEMIRQELKTARANALAPPVMEILAAATFVGVLWTAFAAIQRGDVRGEDAAWALGALSFAFVHVRRLGRLYSSLQQVAASARRVFEVLDQPIQIRDASDASDHGPFRNAIEFRAVQFSYGRGTVLQELDLEIRRGEVHALVGASGSGKSTLAMMMLRMFDPDHGVILLDGVDIKHWTIRSLRRQFAWVTQETHLFDGTVAENIAYGLSDCKMQQIEAAARMANAEEFILTLPSGYQTALGERGSSLSVGQKQRIAIARAMLRDAPILILDEATSALDSESETHIQRALDNLLEDRTALIIAHRLITVQRADRIHVMSRGAIVESGSHAELIARNGYYARLVELQSSGSQDLDQIAATLESGVDLKPGPSPP